MLIKSVTIVQFGKLKNRTLEFQDGINVIQGDNEAGKSTLQSFILSAFYGARTSRKNNLDIRKRYIPHDKDHTFGTMEIQSDHRNLVIERKISGRRKEDLFRIYDKDTYDQVPYTENLGKEILDLELEEFLKTLYISQNGTKFQSEKDEGLSTKLTNLLESGDEDVSFTKAMNIIDGEMKGIKGTRKSGKLDSIYLELSRLHVALDQAESARRKRMEMTEKLEYLEKEMAEIRDRKKDIRLLKDQVHLYAVKNEFLRIRKNLEELRTLKEQKITRFIVAEDKEMKKIREREMKLRDLTEDLSLLENHLTGLRRQKIELDLALEPYKGYGEIGRESILTMVRLQGEELLLQEKLKYFGSGSPLNRNLLHRREELNGLLKRYENHLTGLKSRKHVLYFTGAAILLSAFLYQALTKDLWIPFGIGAVALLTLLLSKPLERMRISYHLHKVDAIEADIRTLAEELQMDPSEVIRSKKSIEKMPGDKERVQLERRLEEVEAFKNRVFLLTNTGSVEALLRGEEKYQQLLDQEKELRNRMEISEKETAAKKELKENVFRAYRDSIGKIGYKDGEDDLDTFLDLYDLEVLRLKELENRETALNYALKGLTGDRSEQEVMEELKAIEALGIAEEMDLKDLEDRERAFTEREQALYDERSRVHLKMQGLEDSEPLLIEESILALQEEESRLKRRYEVLELTRSLMKDSYEKLRKEFTGILNDKVTAIYREITGTDRTIKVSDIFSMNYQEAGTLWNDGQLSHGSMEQLYLSLRIAMADMIFSGRKVPLILDEAFSSYDEERLEKTLLYLAKCTDRYQIFIFTCHRREVEILKDTAAVLSL